MSIKLAASILVSTALMLPMAGYTADTDKSSASTMVKDSVITTKIKAELAGEKMSSLVNISVDTDNQGVVTLGGTAANKAAADRAVAIAKSVKGVNSVNNQIKVTPDK